MVTYKKYNYLQYGLLTLLIIQYSTYITCWIYSYLQYIIQYTDFEEAGVLRNKTYNLDKFSRLYLMSSLLIKSWKEMAKLFKGPFPALMQRGRLFLF